MKKIINNPNAVVEEMLQGIEIANPDVLYDREGVVIARKEKSDKVGLVSGGGSGHEPAHAGYVGYGMLDAAVNAGIQAKLDGVSCISLPVRKQKQGHPLPRLSVLRKKRLRT